MGVSGQNAVPYRHIELGAAPALAGYTMGERSQWWFGTRSDEVLANYAALGRTLGVDPSRMVMPQETHTANVATVSTSDGGGGVLRERALLNTDGLVTAERGLLLCIIIGDCTPVYLSDVDGRAVGLLHCGWRPARAGIIGEGVRRMEELGARRDRICGFVGPHVCGRCYEVGDELYEEFLPLHGHDDLKRMFWRQEGKLHLELAVSIRAQLLEAGVSAEHIGISDECTYHGDSYFSFRRGDTDKRNLAFAMLP